MQRWDEDKEGMMMMMTMRMLSRRDGERGIYLQKVSMEKKCKEKVEAIKVPMR